MDRNRLPWNAFAHAVPMDDALAALYFTFQTGAPGFQFEEIRPWIPALNINYHVGVDGINVGLVLMGAIVAFADVTPDSASATDASADSTPACAASIWLLADVAAA